MIRIVEGKRANWNWLRTWMVLKYLSNPSRMLGRTTTRDPQDFHVWSMAPTMIRLLKPWRKTRPTWP